MWLDSILESASELESPKQFWYWSALCALSAVLKDSVYLDQHAVLTYPNIYVILIAKSGLRKGAPVALAQDLVRRAGNTRVIEGRGSIQGIVKELSIVANNGSGKTITDSCGFFCNDEFAASLVEDKAAMTLLTTLYDRNYHDGPWNNTLKSGKETLLKELITHREIKGGFVGRTFFVLGNRKNTINALTRPLKNKLDREKMACYLIEASKLRGGFDWNEEAREIYEGWYQSVSEKDSGDDDTGTTERIGAHVLKVAMLLHVARELTLILEPKDIEDALEACSPFISSAATVTIGHGTSKPALEGAEILKEIIYAKRVARKDILKRHWANITAVELDSIMDTFIQAGYVIEGMENNVKYYYIADKILEAYMEHKRQ
jgi:hypothetical protein